MMQRRPFEMKLFILIRMIQSRWSQASCLFQERREIFDQNKTCFMHFADLGSASAAAAYGIPCHGRNSSQRDRSFNSQWNGNNADASRWAACRIDSNGGGWSRSHWNHGNFCHQGGRRCTGGSYSWGTHWARSGMCETIWKFSQLLDGGVRRYHVWRRHNQKQRQWCYVSGSLGDLPHRAFLLPGRAGWIFRQPRQ